MSHLRARPAAILLSFLSIAATLSAARGGEKVRWCIAAKTESGFAAINPVSRQSAAIKIDPDRVPSPDGTMAAVIVREKDRRPIELRLEHPNGASQHLVSGSEQPRDVHWLPDGKSFVCAHGERDTQVYLIELDSPVDRERREQKISEVRLSDGKTRATKPIVSSKGAIAWLQFRQQDGKAQLQDLMMMRQRGEGAKPIVERAPITAVAFSPDGSKIAYSTYGELFIIDAMTGQQLQTRNYQKLDERLYAHHALSLAWSPDGGEIAAPLRFSGGREYSGDGPHEPMFGDREVFIIPLKPEYKMNWCTLPEDVLSADWIDMEQVPSLR